MLFPLNSIRTFKDYASRLSEMVGISVTPTGLNFSLGQAPNYAHLF